MAKKIESDVLIVGAGTSGAFIAWRLAEAGHTCLVAEREALDELGTRIGPFHMEKIAFQRFDIPLPAGSELLHTVSEMSMWSPGFDSALHFSFPIYVLDKPLFIRRLHGYARDAGVTILEGTVVTDVIRESGYLRGLRAKGPDGDIELRGRLVVDASGIDGAVRTLMPPGPWLETLPISILDTIFVYMETWNGIEGELPPGVSSYPYYQGWCAPGEGDSRIVGIGMTGSPEAARRRHRRMVDRLRFTGEAVDSTGGRVPYRRPPLSLVDNGLMIAGDAAFMNKPFSGEGVTSGFTACRIAVDVARSALSLDDVTREALWPYNSLYFRDQGAKFAFLTAVLPALMSMNEVEMEFLFDVPGLLTEEAAVALQTDYRVDLDIGETLAAMPHMLKGLASRDISARTLLTIGRAALAAGALQWMYKRYPQHPTGFGIWSRRVMPLWRYIDAIRYRYFSHLAIPK